MAAGHAGQADCQDCREFSKKVESNLPGIFMAGFLPSVDGSTNHHRVRIFFKVYDFNAFWLMLKR